MKIHLGYEIRTGAAVFIPSTHMAVTGQTQLSGKTTTLEALVSRSEHRAITFVTKRGEGSFAGGNRLRPYFRDRADWQFVTSIIDATLQEKNKFLRPWIMKICRTTKTLKEVQEKVREAMKTAKGINEGVYTQLDEYLNLIVPEIGRADLAKTLDLRDGMNVMDVSGYATPMQMLFIQSALDWINEREKGVIVVIPEAWEFIPEGKGSPVKHSAITLVRKGAALGNFIWPDSQDMAGVDKTILRGCSTWIIGVQREANEIKRTLDNIPAGVAKPKAADIALLELGQFFACWGRHCIKTYVQPAWMSEHDAQNIAIGHASADDFAHKKPKPQTQGEDPMWKEKAEQLEKDNAELKREISSLRQSLDAHMERATIAQAVDRPVSPPLPVTASEANADTMYERIKSRLMAEAPVLLKVLVAKPELEVTLERKVLETDGHSLKGRVARLIAAKFFDDGKTQSATRTELKRHGPDVNSGNLSREIDYLVREGFLTNENGTYFSVKAMKVNIKEV